jgi:hypothetical protein
VADQAVAAHGTQQLGLWLLPLIMLLQLQHPCWILCCLRRARTLLVEFCERVWVLHDVCRTDSRCTGQFSTGMSVR